MDVLDILRRTGGVDAMARELGIRPSEAAAGTAALMPAMLGGVAKLRDRMGQAPSTDGLIAALKSLGGGQLAEAVMLPGATDTDPGKLILNEIFGSPQVSRIVAQHAAKTSSIDAAHLRQMLPLLAMLVGGYISALASTNRLAGLNDAWIGSLLDFEATGNPLDNIMISQQSGKAE